MLHLLKEYADKHGLVTKPGFKPQDIQWAITLDKRGRFLEVIPLGDAKRGMTFNECPYTHYTIDGATRSQFLWEYAEIVAYHGVDMGDGKIRPKNEYFLKLLRKAGEVLPELKLIADALEKPDTLKDIRSRLSAKGVKPTNKVTFAIGSNVLLRDSGAWHDWWRQYFASYRDRKGAKVPRMRCFVTGRLATPARTHPMISGLGDVGGQGRASLVNFNQPAFCSYGLKQSANAAVSEEAAVAYSAALNHLVKKHSSKLAGAKVLHWFKERIPAKEDPVAFLCNGDDKIDELNAQRRVEELLDRIKTGKQKYLLDNFYYALMVSGVKSRIMVRDWMEGRFEQLVANVNKWFRNLAITNLDGTQNANNPRIEAVITCLLPPQKRNQKWNQKRNQKYRDWIKPVGGERVALWRAAVRGDPIQSSVIGRLVTLHRSFCVEGTLEKVLKRDDAKEKDKVLSLLYVRMALIKAYHIRKGDLHMSSVLNEKHPNPAYHCGRLLAMLANVQNIASDYKVKSGVAQRYYAAASTTPGLVFGRLSALSQHHLAKIASDNPGRAYNLEIKIASIWKAIKDNVPAILSLEQQSLFALGYYQQVADMRTKKSESNNEDKETENE
jgi:CRISPR-associated protein Csd1